MNTVNGSIFDQMIHLYNDMQSAESALETDLIEKEPCAAAKEVRELEHLEKQMSHLSEECPSIAKPMEDVLDNMEGHLQAIMTDIKLKDFSAAGEENRAIPSNLGAIFHILMIG